MQSSPGSETQRKTYVIQGKRVTLPCVVRDASSGSAIFLVPAELAQKLIPGDAYEMVEMAPGQAQLILGFVDYRDNDLGDYNEVMIIFFVKPKGAPLEAQGTYIYKLPVNQSFTCEAGTKIWGFPKSVEQIDVHYEDHRVTCKLVMDGQHVFTLTLPRPQDGAETPDIEMTTYTYMRLRPEAPSEEPHAVPFTSGGTTAVVPGGDGVVLAFGTHPIAEELRALGLPAAPMMSTWMEHMHGSFGEPRRLESLGARGPA
jgi:hypothetical protein